MFPDGFNESWWIIIETDTGEKIDEHGGSANNIKVADTPVRITAKPYTDLRVTEIIIPSDLPAGEKATISWTVKNSGTAPTSAGYWHDKLYLSKDTMLDESDNSPDALLASIRNPDFLGPGEFYVRTEDIFIPGWVTTGFYYLLIRTDSDDQVAEYDLENNNISHGPDMAEVVKPEPGFLFSPWKSRGQSSPGPGLTGLSGIRAVLL